MVDRALDAEETIFICVFSFIITSNKSSDIFVKTSGISNSLSVNQG